MFLLTYIFDWLFAIIAIPVIAGYRIGVAFPFAFVASVYS